jgi:tRNA/tmRNA/rRNA uracil-C5-methylase (TrmA/RlmC/RlmD family)
MVESDARAVAAARVNLADLGVTVVGDRVDRWLAAAGATDVAVLDPPRSGAGRDVVQRLLGLAPRRIVYVACDPAALARDTATLHDGSYHLAQLRAFDLFPMTAHVECVALFTPTR